MTIYELYFSPTGGTKKCADILTDAMGSEHAVIDMIMEPEALSVLSLTDEDVCVVAVPSYGGRVPAPALERLKTIRGNGAKAVLMAVFGNRSIDDTLTELYETLTAAGFFCIAGVEAVTQHSLMPKFGAGRPDATDEKELRYFGKKITEAIEHRLLSNDLCIPGSRGQYVSYNGVPLKPSASSKCTGCGLCALECPAHAIPKENPRATDKTKCISCMHCVSVCPKNARSYSKILSFAATLAYKKDCSGRKPNRLYY